MAQRPSSLKDAATANGAWPRQLMSATFAPSHAVSDTLVKVDLFGNGLFLGSADRAVDFLVQKVNSEIA